MLFHVSLIHDGAHCPGYHPELIPVLMEAFEKREETARRHNVKVRALFSAAPEHLDIMLIEAEEPFNLALFLSEAWPAELAKIDVKAVTDWEEGLKIVRSRLAG